MEEEVGQMGDVDHIKAQREEVKKKRRALDQEISELAVWQLFSIPFTVLSNITVFRVIKSGSTRVLGKRGQKSKPLNVLSQRRSNVWLSTLTNAANVLGRS